jgi:hypothetical protein
MGSDAIFQKTITQCYNNHNKINSIKIPPYLKDLKRLSSNICSQSVVNMIGEKDATKVRKESEFVPNNILNLWMLLKNTTDRN